MSAFDSDIACVVSRELILLVRAVMFFIDDDDPQVGQRRKDSRACPDHDARISRRRERPLLVSSGPRQPGMQNRDSSVAESLHEAAAGLWRQCDLGNKNERPFSAFEHTANQMNVDLCFA